MNLFTEVYNKSRDLIDQPCFDASWAAIEGKVKTLLAEDGQIGRASCRERV